MISNLLAVAVLAGSALAQQINTPASLVECQPASLTFSGGTPPYIIAALPGGQVSAPAIETLSDSLSSSPYTWNVNLPAGTNITLRITDSTGAIGYSSPLAVQAGSSQACLNQTAATSGLTPGAVTTTRVSASASATSGGASSAASSAAASSAPASSAAASSAASSAAATSRASSAASSAAGGATSATSAAASAASSAAATSAAASGASLTHYVALPAVVMGVIGAVAALL